MIAFTVTVVEVAANAKLQHCGVRTLIFVVREHACSSQEISKPNLSN